MSLSTTPSSLTRTEPALFRVLLQRRSCPPVAPCQPYLPVWPSSRRLWPPPCSVREMWGAGEKRVRFGKAPVGGSAERAGARVATNQFVRDLDLGVPNANDNRRLEVVFCNHRREVFLGVEVGGRWSAETSVFLRSLAAAKARGAVPWLRGRCVPPGFAGGKGCLVAQLPGLSAALSWMAPWLHA